MSTSGQYLALRIGRTTQVGPAGYPNVTGYINLGVAMPTLVSWKVNPMTARLNGRTARHMGFDNPEFGVISCTVNFDFLCEVDVAHAFSLPRATFLDVRLYTTGSNVLPSWQFPTLRLFKPAHSVECEGQYKITAELEPAGPFRGPGEAEWTAANIIAINAPAAMSADRLPTICEPATHCASAPPAGRQRWGASGIPCAASRPNCNSVTSRLKHSCANAATPGSASSSAFTEVPGMVQAGISSPSPSRRWRGSRGRRAARCSRPAC